MSIAGAQATAVSLARKVLFIAGTSKRVSHDLPCVDFLNLCLGPQSQPNKNTAGVIQVHHI